jgi:hypothetical protein
MHQAGQVVRRRWQPAAKCTRVPRSPQDCNRELRSIDPSTGIDAPFPDRLTSNIVQGLGAISDGAAAIDNNAGRLYVMGIGTTDQSPRLFVIDAVGSTPAMSYPAGQFRALAVACR